MDGGDSAVLPTASGTAELPLDQAGVMPRRQEVWRAGIGGRRNRCLHVKQVFDIEEEREIFADLRSAVQASVDEPLDVAKQIAD